MVSGDTNADVHYYYNNYIAKYGRFTCRNSWLTLFPTYIVRVRYNIQYIILHIVQGHADKWPSEPWWCVFSGARFSVVRATILPVLLYCNIYRHSVRPFRLHGLRASVSWRQIASRRHCTPNDSVAYFTTILNDNTSE